jgi:hypothetical protein
MGKLSNLLFFLSIMSIIQAAFNRYEVKQIPSAQWTFKAMVSGKR